MIELPGAHQSIWRLNDEPEYSPLSGDATVDVAVVGGGITGVTAALLLKRAGLRVALLEMNRIGSGVTGNATAHLSTGLDLYYHRVAEKHGGQNARLLAGAAKSALGRIARFVEEEEIDCDFRRTDGFLYAEPGQEVSLVGREVGAAREAGIDVEEISPARVPLPFTVAAAARFSGQACFDPIRYVRALAARIPGDGSVVHEKTQVIDIHDGDPCRLTTEHGTLRARAVLECTHVPLKGLIAFHPRVYPYRSYVLGLRLRAEVPDGLFWDVASPYHYLRRAEGPEGALLLVGGEDHKTGHDPDTEQRYRVLGDYARARFDVEKLAYWWSAQVFEPADDLPFIGLKPGTDHLFTATGFGGDGLILGTAAASLLTDLVLGRDNPTEALFSPARLQPFSSTIRMIAENVNVGYHFLIDRLFAAEEDRLAELAPGEGLVAEVEMEQVGVYRDEQGVLHALSPVCTHARCIVQWNGAERTWDCPCHGGRYDALGHVLNGPPVEDLKRVNLSALRNQREKDKDG